MSSMTSTRVPAQDDTGHSPVGERSCLQIAWWRPMGDTCAMVDRLARRFEEFGLAPGITAFAQTADDDLPEFDLLLLEYTRTNRRELARTVRKIRNHSVAPVVVLVRAEISNLTVAALGAGADLVLPLSTSEEVIAVHCRALLRRWCSSM